MNVWLLVVFILQLVLLGVMIYLCERKITPIDFREPTIPQFSVDVKWDEYPSMIDIENEFDCNADSLRVCLLDDPTTLFGCKELAVKCHHFENDTEYHSNGQVKLIPKNTSTNEGYALPITTLADSCNPFHGDYTLVAADNDSTEYMLICTCKDPGLIGNDNILGNCTNVSICNGQIDDINKPLDEINCVCSDRETNIRYENGIPSCKELLVHEANDRFTDWTALVPWIHNRLNSIDIYNADIRSNLHVKQLLDPCRNSILDMHEEIGSASYNPRLKSCYVKTYGIPIRNNTLEQYPDDSSRDKWSGLKTFDAVINSEPYNYIRFTDFVGGKRRLAAVKVELPAYKK